jgi:hypothetical protein
MVVGGCRKLKDFHEVLTGQAADLLPDSVPDFSPFDDLRAFVLICDYTGKEVVG